MTEYRHKSETKLQKPRAEPDDDQVAMTAKPARLVRDLGWTKDEAAETRHRLAAFADDWDDPSMDVYDEQPSAICQ